MQVTGAISAVFGEERAGCISALLLVRGGFAPMSVVLL